MRMRFTEARHPAAFFSNGIGDHILALPSVRCLSSIFGNRLTLITSPDAPATFFGDLRECRFIEAVFWNDTGVRCFDASSLLERLAGCDLFLSLVPWDSISLQTLVSRLRPAPSIGLTFDYFDFPVASTPQRHAMDDTFAVCSYLDGARVLSDYVGPVVSTASVLQDTTILLPRTQNTRLLVVHPDTKADKCWPLDRWTEFIEIILMRHEWLNIAIVGCSKHRFEHKRYLSRVTTCIDIGLATALKIASSADFFVGIDSCMLHAADLADVPSVGLFGPTNPKEWGLRVAKISRHVVSDTKKMGDIPVESVLRAVEEIICAAEDSRGRPPAGLS